MRAIYVGVAIIVATACLVNAFSVGYDLARLGRPHRLWEPFIWEASSAAVIGALLALPRQAAKLAGGFSCHPVISGISLVGLALAFSAAHICGMVLLRDLAYAVTGATYRFNWSVGEVIYELRKDLFSFSIIGVIFWLAERAFARSDAIAPTPVSSDQASASDRSTEPARIWLRDGRTSILVDAGDVVCITSAGNYVEYVMGTGSAI